MLSIRIFTLKKLIETVQKYPQTYFHQNIQNPLHQQIYLVNINLVLYQNLYKKNEKTNFKLSNYNYQLRQYIILILTQLGCQLWTVDQYPNLFQSNPTMVVGIEANDQVLSMVSTNNKNFSSYYSQIQQWNQVDVFPIMLKQALVQFEKKNGVKCKFLVIYCNTQNTDQFNRIINELYNFYRKIFQNKEIIIIRVKTSTTKYFHKKDDEEQISNYCYYGMINKDKQRFTILLAKKKALVYKIYKANNDEENQDKCLLKFPLNENSLDQFLQLTLRLYQMNYSSQKGEKVNVVGLASQLKYYYEELEECCQIFIETKNNLEQNLYPVLPFSEQLSNQLFYV